MAAMGPPAVVLLLLALLASPACDPRSGAPAAGPAPRGSRLGETCGSTGDCEEPLRCLQATCASPQTSRVGELRWAAAQVAAERGLPTAADLFQQALVQFEADKQAAPPALLCDYGAALRRAAGDAKTGEPAARLLHRCLLVAAPGSAEHARALRELVQLVPRGLDPTLVARDETADRYLVAEPVKAPVDTLKIEVARTTPATAAGYEAFARKLEAPEARPIFQRCFAEAWGQTMAARMVVVLAVKNTAVLGDDDEVVGGKWELPAAPEDAGALAACLRAGLLPIGEAVAKAGSGSFAGALTITLAAAP
jgi:hypothetical protein